MSKLEEKLNELGYLKYNSFIYIKYMRELKYLRVDLEIDISTLTGRISTDTKYYFEKEANDFIKAFNTLQQDLEVLRKHD